MFGIFRKKTAVELSAQAEELFARGEYGDAKLAFDRAAERAHAEARGAAQEQDKRELGELALRAEARAAESCDRIAEARLQAARELARDGDHELAHEELRHALETVRAPALRERLLAAQRELDQREVLEREGPAAALSDEERILLITGSWEPLQAQELEAHGEALQRALLALEDGRADEAAAQLEALLGACPEEPSYLWLEIGRARLAQGQDARAAEALRRFLSRIGPEEGGAARLLAHRELARVAHEAGDQEAAIAELEAAAAALEDDPRPLLDLGNYLRLIKRPREAIEVLELCARTFEERAVEWPVTMELGLACADAGEDARAIAALEAMLDQLVGRGHTDFPPGAVTVLAKLHERAGNLPRAASLYRALCEGPSAAESADYHLEAARLLEALGLADEAARMRARGEALAAAAGTAAPDPELR
jgi:tetratricopeptide (TPR) repeat protein